MTFDRRSKRKILQFLTEINPKQTVDVKAKQYIFKVKEMHKIFRVFLRRSEKRK